MSKQWDIIEEVLRELKEDPSVIAVNLFGSLAVGTERPDSDIDIEVVSDTERTWRMAKEMRHGFEVDYVYTPKDFLLDKIARYPFLSYVHLNEKVLHDPEGLMTQVRADLVHYYESHPEVKDFWERHYALMREQKMRGEVDPQGGVKAYDEAERLFSDSHTVTRTFWRE